MRLSASAMVHFEHDYRMKPTKTWLKCIRLTRGNGISKQQLNKMSLARPNEFTRINEVINGDGRKRISYQNNIHSKANDPGPKGKNAANIAATSIHKHRDCPARDRQAMKRLQNERKHGKNVNEEIDGSQDVSRRRFFLGSVDSDVSEPEPAW